MKTLIDISVTTGATTPEWPGDTPFSCGWAWNMSAGASVNVSTITMSPHVGTHADAPVHVRTDAPGADRLPLEAFFGLAVVADVSEFSGAITLEQIDRLLDQQIQKRLDRSARARLLLKTNRTIANGTFPEDWPALSTECAHALVARGLLLLGVDAPSVDDRNSKTLPVHHALFDNLAFVLENLDLRAVTPGVYELAAFPAKFAGLDAAPVRAVLFRPKDAPKSSAGI